MQPHTRLESLCNQNIANGSVYQPSPKKQGVGKFDTGFLLQAKDLPTFKDNDFLNEGQKLHVGEESKKNFLEKLKRDVEVEFPGGQLLLCLP